jgi:hypothetical protein
MRSLIFTLFVVGNTAVTAWGADLTRIDRKIAKEPVYLNKPKYCLVVFGPEAKFRVWLVRDGKDLYVDLNGNADLTEPGERKQIDDTPGYTPTWQIGTITDPHEKTKYTDLKVRLHGTDKKVEIAVQVPFGNGQLSQSTGRAYGYQGLVFADRPEEAPIVHLGGPLTMLVGKAPAVLVRGQARPIERARIGTPGHGRGTFVMVDSMDGVAISSDPIVLVELQFTDANGKKKVALEELVFD